MYVCSVVKYLISTLVLLIFCRLQSTGVSSMERVQTRQSSLSMPVPNLAYVLVDVIVHIYAMPPLEKATKDGCPWLYQTLHLKLMTR